MDEHYVGEAPLDIRLRGGKVVLQRNGTDQYTHTIDSSPSQNYHHETHLLTKIEWDLQVAASLAESRTYTIQARHDDYEAVDRSVSIGALRSWVALLEDSLPPHASLQQDSSGGWNITGLDDVRVEQLPGVLNGASDILLTLSDPSPRRLRLDAVERLRPSIYDAEHVREIAFLGLGHPHISDSVAELLVNNSRWRVIDRKTLERIMREQDMQHTDRFDPETAVRLGKLSGVQAVVFGEYYGDGQGRDDRAVVKVVDVETAEYLVFKTISMADYYGGGSGSTSYELNAKLVARSLLPSTIEWSTTEPPTVIDVFVGNDADKRPIQ